MHSKFISATVISLAALASAPAFAGQYLGGEVGMFAADAPSTSMVSRADVRAQAQRAVQQGTMAGGLVMSEYHTPVQQAPVASRAEVREQTAMAVQNGLTIGGKV